MSFLGILSIRRKLMLVILATSIATLLLSAAGFAFTDWMSRRGAAFERLRAQAEMIGDNSVAALTFADAESAANTLASLKNNASIVGAVLFDPDGAPFARYVRAGDDAAVPANLPSSQWGTIGDAFYAVSPIFLGAERVGSIFILSDSRHLRQRRLSDIGIALGVLLVSLAVAFVLSHRLQHVVSDPILDLAKTTRRVRKARNYGLRAKRTSADEIGTLVDDFNAMLAQIQLRDHELNQAREHLEHKVEERTRELTELTRKLEYQAYHDTLTGLANRVRFDARLRQTMEEAKRYRGRLAVLGLDLDRFKNINDTLGHAIGDKLLVQVARRLSGCLRASDTLARLGGDEFSVLLPHVADPQDVAILAERLVETLAAPVEVNGYSLHVTTSVGISLYPDDADAPVAMMKNADTAMYRSKELGRNRFSFYSAEMNARAQRRLALDSRLREALSAGRLEVHYQPIVDAQTLDILAVEALLRWPDPGEDYQDVTATEIFSLAEESGLGAALDEWVLLTASRDVAAWHRQGEPWLGLAVNVCPAHFIRENFPEVITEILDHTGFPADRLELEITESLFGTATPAAGSILERLRGLGIELCIDDFGTAHSSLSRLKQLPLQTLKIDRSFIRDLGTDPDDEVIVRTIIQMAHSLNLRVVAEGIETATQLEHVTRQGCDAVQGYLISMPITGEAMSRLLRECERGPSGCARAALPAPPAS